jgi:predicted transcriptional regulator
MPDEQTINRSEILALTSQIVSAHLSNNPIPQGEVTGLIGSVFDSLKGLGVESEAPAEVPTPAVAITRSVTDEHIVCLEDGLKLKTLKRHLMTYHGMTPQEYRAKWSLTPDYPMVAPAYARVRQELAKQFGLGREPASKPKGRPRKGKAKAA